MKKKTFTGRRPAIRIYGFCNSISIPLLKVDTKLDS